MAGGKIYLSAPVKTARKKSRRRRRRTRVSTSSVALSTHNSPLTRTLKANLIYCESYGFASVDSTPSVQVMSLNGCYDPDITGVLGHQPRGFDELVGVLYDHYVVIGTKVTLDLANYSVTVPAHVFVQVRDSSTAVTDWTSYAESSNTKYITLAPENSGGNVRRMTLNVNPNKFLGRSKPMSDPQLKGSSSGNPTEQCYLHIAVVSTDFSTASNVAALVKMEYKTILIEPKNPTQS